jgi:hypothetical protein
MSRIVVNRFCCIQPSALLVSFERGGSWHVTEVVECSGYHSKVCDEVSVKSDWVSIMRFKAIVAMFPCVFCGIENTGNCR